MEIWACLEEFLERMGEERLGLNTTGGYKRICQNLFDEERPYIQMLGKGKMPQYPAAKAIGEADPGGGNVDKNF